MKPVLALLWMIFFIAPPAGAQSVTVFAAASLRGVLEDLVQSFPGEVSLSFGGSGTMARQVGAGAPADVVVLASPLWMDWLVQQNQVSRDAPRVLARNTLVVIGPAGAAPLEDIDALPDRLGDGRLAMGHRDAVPAGTYAQEWLRAAGLWKGLTQRLAETDNVRTALALVARGEAPLGVVYATDAVAEPRVAVIYDVPDDLHAPILYPGAALTPEGAAFLDHLSGNPARKVWAAHGFRAP